PSPSPPRTPRRDRDGRARTSCGCRTSWLLARWSRFGFSPWRCAFSLCRDPARRRQRGSPPRDKLIGFVEQPLRRAPKGEIYGAALLLVVEGRKGLGFLKDGPVAVINPEIERVARHHPEHQPIAEHAGLSEHPPHRDTAQRSELLAQELGKAVAGDHPLSPSSAHSSGDPLLALEPALAFVGDANAKRFQEAAPTQWRHGDGAALLHPLRPGAIKAAFHERGSDCASDVRASFGPIEAQPAECGAGRTQRGKVDPELGKKTGACCR